MMVVLIALVQDKSANLSTLRWHCFWSRDMSMLHFAILRRYDFCTETWGKFFEHDRPRK